MGDSQDAFDDREENRAYIKARLTRQKPRKTLHRGGAMKKKITPSQKREYVKCDCGKIINIVTLRTRGCGWCGKKVKD